MMRAPFHRFRVATTCLLLAAALVLGSLASGCATTRYYERAKLADRAMQLDADPRLVFILNGGG